jgi:hypothetical protein
MRPTLVTFSALDDAGAVHGAGSGIIRFDHMDHALFNGKART